MPLQEVVPQLNWVDWLVVAIVVLSTAAGVGRGFLLGALDLASMVVSLAVAMAGYGALTDLLVRLTPVPRALATLFAFLLLLLVAQLVYAWVVRAVLRVVRPLLLLLLPLGCVNQGLGVVPGAVKGALVSVVLLLPFALFPLAPPVSAAIERSAIGSQLLSAAIGRATDLEAVLGPRAAEGLAFLAPPQTDEGFRIDFGAVGELAPDPDAERQMLTLVNREREKVGVRPLTVDAPLQELARVHSREMFERGYFSHTSPSSGSPFDRMRAAGITFSVAGENLAYAPNVQMAHDGLMNSPGHRANILNPQFGKIGIGAIKSRFRGTMFSQELTN